MIMTKKNITIEFPEDKLNVLLFFLNREQQSLETLMEEQLERLYNRMVPKPTRDFIQFQMTGEVAPDTEEVQEVVQGTATSSGTKRNKKQERQTATAASSKPDTPKTDGADQVEEESTGMQMGM
jgi:uncharacterized membrane protein